MAITYFGNTSVVSARAWGQNQIAGNLYTAPVSGNITTGHIQGTCVGPDSTKVRMAVYAQSGSDPGALVCLSDEQVLTVAMGLTTLTLTFSTPGAVVSGTPYYLMFYLGDSGGGTSMNVRRTNVGTARHRVSGITYPTPANPFGTAGSVTDTYYIEAGIDDTPAAAAFVPRIIAIT